MWTMTTKDGEMYIAMMTLMSFLDPDLGVAASTSSWGHSASGFVMELQFSHLRLLLFLDTEQDQTKHTINSRRG